MSHLDKPARIPSGDPQPYPVAEGRHDCELCDERDDTTPVWRDADWRVVRVRDAAFPAFYRVIHRDHVREMTQLAPAARHRALDLVCAVERTLIAQLQPTKINLASLGNVVPHLHWHVIARFDWDSHFPQPVWGTAQREAADAVARLAVDLPTLDAAVREALVAA